MKPSLQVRLSQHLALTPQLQQSIRLLQLSTLELQQEVGQLLDQYPFLELDDDGPPTPYETPPERQATDQPPDREADSAEPAAEPAALDGAPQELAADEFGTPLRDDWENGTEGDDFDGIRETPSGSTAAASDGDDDGEAHDRRAAPGSLQDHLRGQLVGRHLEPEDRAAVEVLIESPRSKAQASLTLDGEALERRKPRARERFFNLDELRLSLAPAEIILHDGTEVVRPAGPLPSTPKGN